MYRIEFFETRDEYDNRRPDSTFCAMTMAEAETIQYDLLKNNPDAVVSVGRK